MTTILTRKASFAREIAASRVVVHRLFLGASPSVTAGDAPD